MSTPDLALELAARAGPGIGAEWVLRQTLGESPLGNLAFELGLERQELFEQGREGDDWSRLLAGLRWRQGATRAGPEARLGVTWVRSEAAPAGLDLAGDYGGGYLTAGWKFALGAHLAIGPELGLLYLDSEGDRAGSAALLVFAWRFEFGP